jgi:hypothetical protein
LRSENSSRLQRIKAKDFDILFQRIGGSGPRTGMLNRSSRECRKLRADAARAARSPACAGAGAG